MTNNRYLYDPKTRTEPADELEAMVYHALMERHIEFKMTNTARLDFYLPNQDIYIEVKRMFSPHIADQCKRVQNIIVLQGLDAVSAFCNLLKNGIFS